MFKKIVITTLLTCGLAVLYAGTANTSDSNEKEVTANAVKAKDCNSGCCTSTASPTSPKAAGAALPRDKRPDNAEVYIISPKDGDVVDKEFKVIFGLKGMGVAPAGINLPNTGHHHLLVDVDKLPDMSMPIPADKNHIHFGKGQTETTLKLEPGKHTLQLLLGNYVHIPHDKEVISKKITVTVK